MSRHDDELRWRGSRQVVGKPGVKRQVANGQIRDRDDVVVLRSNEQLLRRVLHTLLFHYYLNKNQFFTEISFYAYFRETYLKLHVITPK